MERPQSPIAVANQHVRITLAVRWAGSYVEDFADRDSVKIHCPFEDVYHDDNEPAMRVYPAPGKNNAWCFAEAQFFTPVSLLALAWDVTPEDAAAQALDRIGHTPVTYPERWRELTSSTAEPDRDALAAALRTFCERIDPLWGEHQYLPWIAEHMATCLGLLQVVHTAADCELWLSRTKDAMAWRLQKVVTA